MLKKATAKLTRKGLKNLAISIVILIEVLAISAVSVFAWVETVSSIKIFGDGVIDTYVLTDAEIGSGTGTIDMASYFKQSGDMHLAPASSANGKTIYFPQAGAASTNKYYRKGNSSDKNTNYLSVTFRVKTTTNADFFFVDRPNPETLDSDIRISVTSQTEGSDEAPVTKIYAKSSSSSSVVNSTTGTTATANVDAISNHTKVKGSAARLFNVAADETKIVTINVWLQKNSTDMSSAMAKDITIDKLGIISSLTPRRVTLVPTNIWNKDGATFFAWCWNTDSDGKFFEMTDNGDGSYSFDYDGTYKNISFIRAQSGTTKDNIGWNRRWNQTVDEKVPPSPVDPTFFITNMGNSNNDSTGIWEEPATVKVDYVTGHASFGTVKATWSNYTATGNGQGAQILCRGGQSVTIAATASGSYQFDGWYSDAAGTTRVTTSASTSRTAPAKGNEITYYAKFREVATITLYKYVDGSNSSTAAGTIQIDSTSGTGSSVSTTVDKNSSVSLSASAETGYTLDGIYNVATGGTRLSNPYTFTANDKEYKYYARFTTNEWTVTANAYYSNDGSSYTAGDTGGTVKVGSSTTTGSTSDYKVKYNNTVYLYAYPATGYEFVGWYSTTSATTAFNSNATYNYTLSSDNDVTVYARFRKVTTSYYLSGWINGAEVGFSNNTYKFSQGTSSNTYTLTYTFTGHENGYQYVTVNDGSKVYHPSSSNAGSGSTAPTTTDANPNGNNKWRVTAPKGTKVTFTWNSSTRALSWTIVSRDIYLKPNSNWASNNARFAVYAFNTSGNTWINMTSAGNGYYVATVPSTYTTVIFGRMDPGTNTNNFNDPPMWNRTNIDLPIPADKNCFEVPSSDWSTNSTTWTLY